MPDLERLSGLLVHQAEACGRLGSPMYEALLRRAAQQLAVTGPLRDVLAAHADAPGPAATGLRLLGAVHRLVLERRAGDLALYYPSVGGRFTLDAAWPALLDVLDNHPVEVADGMRRPPQTNEVGRAAALVGGLLRVLRPDPMPLRLFELGASAGLNLRAEQFRYVSRSGAWGPSDSPVQLQPAWTGTSTPLGTAMQVVNRRGCDPDPLDPTSTEGRLVLTSYVWPDQPRRLERLRGALEIAARVPAEVTRQPAADFVARMHLLDDHVTVLWHSVMWQYLDADEQDIVTGQVRRLAQQASLGAPFVYVSLEPGRRAVGADHEFLVLAETWPVGERQVLGVAQPHGFPVQWEC